MSFYDLDSHIAELYDQQVTETRSITLLRALIGEHQQLRILEPFCGTGRISIPLAQDGHYLVGMDNSRGMLERAHTRVKQLPSEIQENIDLIEKDVINEDWPGMFDVVVLGGNCMYELPGADEQSLIISRAVDALRPGGYLFLDNDHMEGDLAPSWYDPPEVEGVFPTGTCADGTIIESRWRVTWYDSPARLIRFLRQTHIIMPDGITLKREYTQQKHPVSKGEVSAWLIEKRLRIEKCMGNYEGHPYQDGSPRAIFWVRK